MILVNQMLAMKEKRSKGFVFVLPLLDLEVFTREYSFKFHTQRILPVTSLDINHKVILRFLD